MILGLYIKADLDNVDSIRALPGICWQVDVKESTGEEVRENVYFTSNEVHNIPNSRGEANFIIKWKISESRASLKILDEGIPYTSADSGSFKCIAKFDVRGLDVIKWHPKDGFEAERNGKTYSVVFQDNAWADYDEEANESISALNLEYKFDKI